jgi:hypothetical protein
MASDARDPTPAPADEPRDPMLRAALRHAPDAGLGPPDMLSARILAAAHAATPTEQARPRSWRERIAAALAAAWAATARPSFAGGFATVVIATLAGVLWWQRPLEDMLPSDRARTAAATNTAAPAPAAPKPQVPTTPAKSAERAGAAEAPSAPATARAPDAFPATPAAALAAPRAQMKTPGRAADRPGAEHDAAADATAGTAFVKPSTSSPERERTDRVTAAPQAAAAKRGAGKERGDAPEETAAEARSAAPRAGLSALSPEAPREERAREPAAGTLQRSAQVATGAEGRRAEAQGSAAGAKRAAVATDARREEPAGEARLEVESLSPVPPPVALGAAPSPMPTDAASLRTSIDAEPERWSWSRSGEPVRHSPDVVRAWLARVEAARGAASDTAPATQGAKAAPAGEPAPAAANALDEVPELRLFRDGRLVATLRIRGRVLELTDASGGVHRTPLEPGTAAALAASMPR